MNKHVIEWKWSNGNPIEQSVRRTIVISDVIDAIDVQQQAINLSLFNGNKNLLRDEQSSKLSDRELIGQRGTNPFLINSNYVNDIVTRDIYLKPINTTFDKTKSQINE